MKKVFLIVGLLVSLASLSQGKRISVAAGSGGASSPLKLDSVKLVTDSLKYYNNGGTATPFAKVAIIDFSTFENGDAAIWNGTTEEFYGSTIAASGIADSIRTIDTFLATGNIYFDTATRTIKIKFGDSIYIYSTSSRQVLSGGGGGADVLTWTGLSSGLATNGNNGLTSSSAGEKFGRSVELISTDQYLEWYNPNDAGKTKIIGLVSQSTMDNQTDIEFGFYNNTATHGYVFINGSTSATELTISNPTYIRIGVTATTFILQTSANGTSWTTVHTATKTQQAPYYAAVDVIDNGGVLEQLKRTGTAGNNNVITWTAVDADIISDYAGLKFNAATSGTWDNTAKSVETISTGEAVEFIMDGDNSTQRFIGLTNAATVTDYNDLDFAWFLGGTNIYESGSSVNSPTAPNVYDYVRIFYDGANIKYQRSTDFGANWTNIYTSAATPSGSYNVAVSMRINNSFIHHIRKTTP